MEMALIVCEECGKEYSNKAIACPNCGCPNDIEQAKSMVAIKTKEETSLDKVSPEDVMNHLKYAKELETTLYALKTAHVRIEQKIRTLGCRANITPPDDIEYNFSFWMIFFLCLRYCF